MEKKESIPGNKQGKPEAELGKGTTSQQSGAGIMDGICVLHYEFMREILKLKWLVGSLESRIDEIHVEGFDFAGAVWAFTDSVDALHVLSDKLDALGYRTGI